MAILRISISQKIKDSLKMSPKTVIKKSKYENKKTESLRHIQSETKQAISSLYQVGLNK